MNPQVRAKVLAALLTEKAHARAERIRPLVLVGARITGGLNLSADTLIRPVILFECDIEEEITLTAAHTLLVSLQGSRIAGISAAQVSVKGNLDLRNVHMEGGMVDLLEARIDGQLLFGGATLTNAGKTVLKASGVTVGQGMYCRRDPLGDGALGEPFTADGDIDITGASIGSRLSFEGARLRYPGGQALIAPGVTVKGDLKCDGLDADGGLNLENARIGGDFRLDGVRLSRLDARGIRVGQEMRCVKGFRATGPVDLTDAKIGANLLFRDARLKNTGGTALSAQRLVVEQDMFCSDQFLASGRVDLAGAHVGGVLDFSGAWLRNPGGRALAADSLTVGRSMFCGNGFVARGCVHTVVRCWVAEPNSRLLPGAWSSAVISAAPAGRA